MPHASKKIKTSRSNDLDVGVSGKVTVTDEKAVFGRATREKYSFIFFIGA